MVNIYALWKNKVHKMSTPPPNKEFKNMIMKNWLRHFAKNLRKLLLRSQRIDNFCPALNYFSFGINISSFGQYPST